MAEEFEVSTNRVVRSFAFVDLSGFTTYTDSRGDDEAVEVLKSFRATVREVASARGVRIAKWLGDGAMMVGVEVEPLMEAMVDIVRQIADSGDPLPLRAGLTAGPVILFEGDDYIGQSVNLAARLCDEAASGEVLAAATAITEPLVNIRVEPAGSREIRGFEQPVDLVRLSSGS